MSQIGLTLTLIYRCRFHVLDRSYTDTQQADAMSQTGLTLASSHNVAGACPRHVLH
ncbi:Putative leucine--tRNA ligase, mitochondrial [Gossypium arboreum]|uniref:Putative leucine--tRNA ligase, mitochondrial n=1 Tax=Gossypium arboreum TaxID=29729 RepID=A0A0B0MXY1_GOSAR|nr:Putative leucine--tRNA ligase, mitochondrial [Gossypium arboreum]